MLCVISGPSVSVGVECQIQRTELTNTSAMSNVPVTKGSTAGQSGDKIFIEQKCQVHKKQSVFNNSIYEASTYVAYSSVLSLSFSILLVSEYLLLFFFSTYPHPEYLLSDSPCHCVIPHKFGYSLFPFSHYL